MKRALVFAALLAATPKAESLPQFLRTSFARHEPALRTRFAASRDRIAADFQLTPGDSALKRDALFLLYLHGLLTTTDAVDCARGGALGTVYFWHWVDPNPRHRIRRLPDSARLTEVRPPQGFGKYKSLADVDRLPSLYLADLASPKPGYTHARCGDFRTFGWCSEREMALGALLKNLGYACKIKQEGIHVWTEVLLTVRGASLCVLRLDTTFDQVEWFLARTGRGTWEKDYGDGAQVGWYNRTAASEAQLGAVKRIAVSDAAEAALEKMIAEWLGR